MDVIKDAMALTYDHTQMLHCFWNSGFAVINKYLAEEKI